MSIYDIHGIVSDFAPSLVTDRPPPPVLPEQAGTSAPLEVPPVQAGPSASSAVPPVQAEFSPETVRPHPRASQQTKSEKKKHTEKNSDSEKEDDFCIVCLESYSRPGEMWLECCQCKAWAHEACTDGGSISFATIVSQMGNCEYLML
ncbi:uncharacterized protein LOC117534359 [Tachysurus ichikawai]